MIGKYKYIYLVIGLLLITVAIFLFVNYNRQHSQPQLFSSQKCPENDATNEERDTEYKNFLTEFMASNPNGTVSDMAQARIDFLTKNNCTQTLKYIQDNGGIEGYIKTMMNDLTATDTPATSTDSEIMVPKEILTLIAEQEKIRGYALEKFRDMLTKLEVSIFPITFDYYGNTQNGSTTIARHEINNHEVKYIVPVRQELTDSGQKFDEFHGIVVQIDGEKVIDVDDEGFVGLAQIKTSSFSGDILMTHSSGSCDCGIFRFIIPQNSQTIIAYYDQWYMSEKDAEKLFLQNNVFIDAQGRILLAGLDSPYFNFAGANPEIKIARVPVLLSLNADTSKFEEYSTSDVQKIYLDLYNRMGTTIKMYNTPTDVPDSPLFNYTNILGFQSQLERLAGI